MIKHPGENNFQFILARNSRLEPRIAGKMRQEDLRATGRPYCIQSQEAERDEVQLSSFFFFIKLMIQHREYFSPQWADLPTSMNLIKKIPLFEVCNSLIPCLIRLTVEINLHRLELERCTEE